MKTLYRMMAVAAVMTAAYTSGAQTAGFLTLNPDPVTLGMGGVGAAAETTPYAMWNNAAASALGEEKFQAGASYMLWQPSAAANNIAAVAGYGRVAEFMTVSAGIKYFGHAPYDVTDASGLVTGQFAPVELQAGIGLGFRILPILSLGANVSYVHSDLGGPEKGAAVSADFGALLDLKFLSIGVTAANIGSRISYGGASSYALPSNLKLGVGTAQHFGNGDRHALSASLEGGMTLERTSFFAGAGVQYAWNDMVRVSAGYHYGDARTQFFGSFASVGVGVRIIGISLNAAYLIAVDNDSPLGNTFSVGLGYSF